MCYETDTGKFKVGTGTVWTSTSYSGGVTAPGLGAITRTVDAKLLDTVSVKDFGAVGDGVADDTSEIQAALDASVGKSLYLPPGTYRTTSSLVIKEGTCFFAQKGTATIDVQPTNGTAGPNTHGILIGGNSVVIDGLKISGTNQFKIEAGIRTEYAKGIVADQQVSGAVYTRPTITNCLFFRWGSGVELRQASTYTVTNNRFWGGEQFADAIGANAGTGDINIYGSAGADSSKRGIITGNFCLGNQDVGIGASGNAGDQDITISNNVIQPLQQDGITALSDANNKSRYGIIIGYVGTLSCRVVVSSNIIRDYGHCGLNCQTNNAPPGGDIVVADNVVSRCGWSVKYPFDASLKAGIWVNGGADSITGNIVLDCTRTGIQYNSSLAIDGTKQHPRAVIANNNIARIAVDTNSPFGDGHGISVIGNFTSGILVSSNRIQAIAGIGIKVGVPAGAAFGNVHVHGNQISTVSLAGGIQVTNGGSLPCSIVGNSIVGGDNTTVNSNLNAGIWFSSGVVHCNSNIITKFYHGIYYETSPARNITNTCHSNAIATCNIGIWAGSGNWIVSTNAISGSVTHDLRSGAWAGVVYKGATLQGFGGGPIVEVADTSAPTSGTWAVGDRCKKTNAAVGQPKGWICTVAGSPGTWVSEGNL
jgi:hypothetical protein